jgi:large subunit ribosomal protein L24
MKAKIHKADTVAITTGKDKGKTGKVEKVLVDQNAVVVENINLAKKHQKAYGNKQGGIFEITKPISISNVQVICPACKKQTRVGFEVKGGVKLRVCKKCKANLDKMEEKKSNK